MNRASSPPKKQKRSRRFWRWLLLILLLLLFSPFLLVFYVVALAAPHTYDAPAAPPPQPVAIVFGAGITPNRNLTPMLADRVQTAVDLYHKRQVKQVLMTGDGSRPSHDEVTPMRLYATVRGVPAKDILLDYDGVSTYDSCYRARSVFQVKEAVLVTQRYHLPRALYTCRGLGIDAEGIGTPDWGIYPDALMTSYSLREGFAILKAFWDVNIARPEPVFVGPSDGAVPAGLVNGR